MTFSAVSWRTRPFFPRKKGYNIMERSYFPGGIHRDTGSHSWMGRSVRRQDSPVSSSLRHSRQPRHIVRQCRGHNQRVFPAVRFAPDPKRLRSGQVGRKARPHIHVCPLRTRHPRVRSLRNVLSASSVLLGPPRLRSLRLLPLLLRHHALNRTPEKRGLSSGTHRHRHGGGHHRGNGGQRPPLPVLRQLQDPLHSPCRSIRPRDPHVRKIPTGRPERRIPVPCGLRQALSGTGTSGRSTSPRSRPSTDSGPPQPGGPRFSRRREDSPSRSPVSTPVS